MNSKFILFLDVHSPACCWRQPGCSWRISRSCRSSGPWRDSRACSGSGIDYERLRKSNSWKEKPRPMRHIYPSSGQKISWKVKRLLEHLVLLLRKDNFVPVQIIFKQTPDNFCNNAQNTYSDDHFTPYIFQHPKQFSFLVFWMLNTELWTKTSGPLPNYQLFARKFEFIFCLILVLFFISVDLIRLNFPKLW